MSVAYRYECGSGEDARETVVGAHSVAPTAVNVRTSGRSACMAW